MFPPRRYALLPNCLVSYKPNWPDSSWRDFPGGQLLPALPLRQTPGWTWKQSVCPCDLPDMNKTSELLSPRAAPSAAQVEIRPPQQLMKPNEPSVCRGLRAGSLCLPGKKTHTKLDKLVPVREEEEGEEQEEGWVVISSRFLCSSCSVSPARLKFKSQKLIFHLVFYSLIHKCLSNTEGASPGNR